MTHSASHRALHAAPLRLFLGQLVPTFLSLVAASSTNLVDGFLVGAHVGADGLAALNLLNPPLNLLFGLALMLGIGGAVRAGRLLGAGESRAASACFSRTLLGVLGLALVLVAAGLAGRARLFAALGADAELAPQLGAYYDVALPFFLVKSQMIALYFFVRLDDRPGLVAASFVLGALAKVGLGALFVASWGWGLRGAAWSTGLATVLAAGILALYFQSPHRRLVLARPAGATQLAGDAANGIAEFVNEASVSLTAFLLNWLLLLRLGVDGLAGIAVYNYTLQLVLMLHFAIAHASQTLVAQNLGAGLHGRTRQFLGMGLGFAVLAGLAAALAVTGGADALAAFFLRADGGAARLLAAKLLHQLWPVFALAGVNITITAWFTARQAPGRSTLLAFARSFALPALLMGGMFHWLPDRQFLYGPALAEMLTLLLALWLLRAERRP